MDNPLSIQASFALGLPECGLPLVLLTDLCLKLSLSWIAIWKTRYNLVYDKSNFCPPRPELTTSLADRSVVEFLSHMRLKYDRNHFNSPPLDSHLWVNPLVGTVKINCVNAWDKVTNAGFAGVVIKDHTGSLLDGSAHCFQSSQVVQAQEIFLSKIGLFTLYDIRMLKASFSSFWWTWTPQDANHAADWVALQTRRGFCAEAWVIRPPIALVFILSHGLPCPPNCENVK
ncbi:PREDICTED: reverse mRNAase, partial [Prunus dulcis]